jgi:uncharacterized protein (TIGR04255 family)
MVKPEDLKSNILDMVVTRIDYQDLFLLSDKSKKQISALCKKRLLTEQLHRTLGPKDFATNDPVSITQLPEDYLSNVQSYVFFNKSKTYFVEINQLFVRITQSVVKGKYEPHSLTRKLLSSILDPLIKNDNINIRRISIKKSNEVFFKEIEDVKVYFKPEIVWFNQFSDSVDWKKPNTKSHLVQNFETNNCNVNLVRIYDNGEIDELTLNRLYLEFETYSFQVDKNVFDKMKLMNDVNFELFINSLTDEAISKLISGEGFGEELDEDAL